MSTPVPHVQQARAGPSNLHPALGGASLQEARGVLKTFSSGRAADGVGLEAPFRSILFDQSENGSAVDGREMPEVFTDLNLDQVVASITAGREEYNLKPFFYTPLSHVETINYRHGVLRDLENQAILGHIRSFAEKMRTMRRPSRSSRQT